MGRLYIYLPEWLFLMVKYGFHVGKYTSPMDPMGLMEDIQLTMLRLAHSTIDD